MAVMQRLFSLARLFHIQTHREKFGVYVSQLLSPEKQLLLPLISLVLLLSRKLNGCTRVCRAVFGVKCRIYLIFLSLFIQRKIHFA